MPLPCRKRAPMRELLRCEDLGRVFTVRRRGAIRAVQAVDSVSLSLGVGETLGVVGESGCGKSTLARLILRLIEPTSGRIVFDETDVTHVSQKDLRPLRRRVQAIFQDPYGSLNPRHSVRRILSEPFVVHGLHPAEGIETRLHELLHTVGLERAHLERRPHELSGGQLQRVAIARALCVEPDLIVADEPTSSLDVSIQAQIVNLLTKIQAETSVAFVFVSHNFNVIRHVSDRIAVMYLGRIVELGEATKVLSEPLHPYTQTLLAAAPSADPRLERARPRLVAEGEPPDAASIPSGCRFHPRCPYAQASCSTDDPKLEARQGERLVACHFAPELTAGMGAEVGVAFAARHESSSHGRARVVEAPNDRRGA